MLVGAKMTSVASVSRSEYLRANTQTDFEKRRGISKVETRNGYAQFQADDLPSPTMVQRLELLKCIAADGISIDFLKFTQRGLSFLVSEPDAERAAGALRNSGVEFQQRKDQSIVLVHAVNMRDEDGLIAEIVQTSIDHGFTIDHLGDMHDRLLLVTSTEQATRLADAIRSNLVGDSA